MLIEVTFDGVCNRRNLDDYLSLQHTATHCNTLQHTEAATIELTFENVYTPKTVVTTPFDTLQRPGTQFYTLQRNAKYCKILQHTLQHTAAPCTTLQHTATHCDTLQPAQEGLATHCSTLQHTATPWKTLQRTAIH